jgi:hypothetical protein
VHRRADRSSRCLKHPAGKACLCPESRWPRQREGLLYQSKPSIEDPEVSTRTGRNCAGVAPHQLWCGLGVRLLSDGTATSSSSECLGGTAVRRILKSPCPMAANSAVASARNTAATSHSPFA